MALHCESYSNELHRQSAKCGSALICAMVTLLVVAAFTSTILRSTLMTRQRMKMTIQARQAEWLLQSGLERANHELRQSDSYEGEVWHLAPHDITGSHPGKIEIRVLSSDDGRWVHLLVIAQYPDVGVESVQRSRTFVVSKSKTPSREPKL